MDEAIIEAVALTVVRAREEIMRNGLRIIDVKNGRIVVVDRGVEPSVQTIDYLIRSSLDEELDRIYSQSSVTADDVAQVLAVLKKKGIDLPLDIVPVIARTAKTYEAAVREGARTVSTEKTLSLEH